VDPLESAARILRGRGGYCCHLNGAFAELLHALGCRVRRHVGGVQGNPERPAGATGNHLVLRVSGLPSPDSPDGRRLVDLGTAPPGRGPASSTSREAWVTDECPVAGGDG
jgi:N-hydroxyarylamine O-acetyltransferase